VSIRLYSTLSRRLEELPPPPGPIGMYVCGSTVYQPVHVGNSRPFVLAMWLRRWLKSRGYDVKLVHNITDVDDKVYEEAAKLGKGSRELAQEATEWFLQDTSDLGLGRPDVEPRASETMPEIIVFIEALIAKDAAYEAQGDVYFRVARYPDYGQLSGAKLEDMIAQEPSDRKEDERDFALWKAQKPHEDAGWPSPWGPGRPGWHIECSAMAEKHLGPEFEIHGGGLDLRFPHHENELAQSRSRGYPFARVWLHNGMLELGDEKMSKSLGNVVTLRNVLDVWGREVLLLYHMSGHWRKPVDFNDEVLQQAQAQLATFKNAFRQTPKEPPSSEWLRLEEALEDDFNTPVALAVLHEWARQGFLDLLERGLDLFGISVARPTTIQIGPAEEIDTALPITPRGGIQYLGAEPPTEAFELVRKRQTARQNRDFAAADELRRQLAELGYKVDDLPDGPLITRLDRQQHPQR
jgi:cysteinyl-tRNA synthetase